MDWIGEHFSQLNHTLRSMYNLSKRTRVIDSETITFLDFLAGFQDQFMDEIRAEKLNFTTNVRLEEQLDHLDV